MQPPAASGLSTNLGGDRARRRLNRKKLRTVGWLLEMPPVSLERGVAHEPRLA
jgi:hypothetical protein